MPKGLKLCYNWRPIVAFIARRKSFKHIAGGITAAKRCIWSVVHEALQRRLLPTAKGCHLQRHTYLTAKRSLDPNCNLIWRRFSAHTIDQNHHKMVDLLWCFLLPPQQIYSGTATMARRTTAIAPIAKGQMYLQRWFQPAAIICFSCSANPYTLAEG